MPHVPRHPTSPRNGSHHRRQPIRGNRENAAGHFLRIHYASMEATQSQDQMWIWCWEAFPTERDLPALEVDEFGAVFEIPHRDLPPRVRLGFRFKLGPGTQVTWLDFDRFWTRKWGWEVWINQGDPTLYRSQRAACRPRLTAAYLDSPTTIEVHTGPRHVALTDPTSWRLQGGKVVSVQERTPTVLLLQTTPITRSSCAEVQVETPWGKAVVGITPRQVMNAPASELPMGAIPSDNLTTFRIFAPRATSVAVSLCRDPHSPPVRNLPLRPVDDGVWEVHVTGNLHGIWYEYHVEGPRGVGEEFEVERPLLDPWAAIAFTSPATHTGRAMVMDMRRMSVQPLPQRRPLQELVIYEAHVRDLMGHPNSGLARPDAERRGYKSWVHADTRGPAGVCTGLDHLVELGVGAVQLLPIHEYPWPRERHHWGYEPAAFFSPAANYASMPGEAQAREFGTLVDALHSRGIAVILDMVFNHTVEGGADGPVMSLKGLDAKYWYRRSSDLFQYANGSGCGNELASERPMARRLIVDCCRHFVDHYKVDGFRFDLLALLDLETLAALKQALPSDVYLYGEPWAASGARWSKGAVNHLLPWAVFNDSYRDAIKGSPEGPWRGFVQGGGSVHHVLSALTANTVSFGAATAWASSPQGSLNYVTCHDNLSLNDKLEVSVPGMSEVEKCTRVKLTAFLQHLSLGPVFIAGGDEFLRSRPFTPGHDGRADRDADSPTLYDANAYRAPDQITNFDWSRKLRYLDVFRTYVQLGQLRRSEVGRCLTLPRRPPPGFMEVFTDAAHPHGLGWGWNADFSYGDYHLRAFVNCDRERPATFKMGGTQMTGWRVLGDLHKLDPSGVGDLASSTRDIEVPPLSALLLARRRPPPA